jgi:hypothetical protein
MKTLVFTGGSDDILSEETTGQELCNNSTGQPLQFDVKDKDGAGLRVTRCYSTCLKKAVMGNGCWMIGVELLSEDKPFVCDVRVMPGYGEYCNRMEIDVDDDVTVSPSNPEEDDD